MKIISILYKKKKKKKGMFVIIASKIAQNIEVAWMFQDQINYLNKKNNINK